MNLFRHSSGLIVLLYLAGVGYALVEVPPRVMSRYSELHDANPVVANTYLGVVVVGGGLVLGISGWVVWRLTANQSKKRKSREQRKKDPSQMTSSQLEKEIAANLATGTEISGGDKIPSKVRAAIKERVEALEAKQEAHRLEIVAFGTISSGKSSLLNTLVGRDAFRTDVAGGTTVQRTDVPWPGRDKIVLADTPGLAEIAGESRAAVSADAARDADLVLFVVDGPLKKFELDLLKRLHDMEKRLLVCLNKTDWFGDRERDELLNQISEQTARYVDAKDVVAIRSRGGSRRRVRILADGNEAEEVVSLEPDIEPLARRMMQVIDKSGGQLLLANLLMQSRGLVDDAKERVLASLDRQADATIRRYMWAAGGATAVNPFPLLDVAGGSAITVKMVLDLAQVYGQSFDADAALEMLGQLGKNLVAIVGVTAVTPAIVAGVGTVIKAVPGVGTLAGGVMQGSVQALVTRWIGRVFTAYFRNEMQPPPGGLTELARREWHFVTRPDEIRRLITATRVQDRDDVSPAAKQEISESAV